MVRSPLSRSARVRNSGWKWAAAALPGPAHQRNEIPCQDAAEIRTGPGCIAACLSDGLGSARLSHLGARAVATCVADLLARSQRSAFRGELSGGSVLDAAMEAIEQAQAVHGGSLDDYACTLVALVISAKRAKSFHLGDGLIGMVEEGSPKVLSPPENYDFVNVVVSVTSPDAHRAMRAGSFSVSPLVTSFVLMTDGPQAALYDRRTGSLSQVVEQMAMWLRNGDREEVVHGIESAIRDHLFSHTDDDCALSLINRELELSDFACENCRRWTIRRDKRKKKVFEVVCAACHHRMRFTASSSAYPPSARAWAKYLKGYLQLPTKQVAAITGISPTTLRRWRQ